MYRVNYIPPSRYDLITPLLHCFWNDSSLLIFFKVQDNPLLLKSTIMTLTEYSLFRGIFYLYNLTKVWSTNPHWLVLQASPLFGWQNCFPMFLTNHATFVFVFFTFSFNLYFYLSFKDVIGCTDSSWNWSVEKCPWRMSQKKIQWRKTLSINTFIFNSRDRKFTHEDNHPTICTI